MLKLVFYQLNDFYVKENAAQLHGVPKLLQKEDGQVTGNTEHKINRTSSVSLSVMGDISTVMLDNEMER